MTVVQGLPRTGRSIQEVARVLKKRLATGGTVKDNLVLLQGDHRSRVKDELVKIGFREASIEVF